MPHDSGLVPALPEDLWRGVAAQLDGRPFLHSEGLSAPLAMPRRMAPWLRAQATQLVEVFDRFFRAIVDAEGALAEEPVRRIGEPYESFARIEGKRAPLPLSRLDCVLDGDTLRVIELNPIGVCTLHLRAVAYLARLLVRTNDPRLEELARGLDGFRVDKIDSIRRFADATLEGPPARPTVAISILPGMHRGTKHIWTHELREGGMDVIVGPPRDLGFEDGRLTMRGRKVDVLWADFLVYLGYQQVRYEQTRFESRVGNFSMSAHTSAMLLEQLGLIAAVVDRTVTLVSPVRGYRALSKGLLAWVDRDELAISDEDRAFVRAHLAETWDHRRRAARSTIGEAARRREELVLKPCRFGGAHGVVIGRECEPGAWEKQVTTTWDDPEWVLQEFIEPNLDADGARLSYGLYNYAGVFGGMLVRSASQTIVGARNAGLIAAL